jgi:hypothetical protein
MSNLDDFARKTFVAGFFAIGTIWLGRIFKLGFPGENRYTSIFGFFVVHAIDIIHFLFGLSIGIVFLKMHTDQRYEFSLWNPLIWYSMNCIQILINPIVICRSSSTHRLCLKLPLRPFPNSPVLLELPSLRVFEMPFWSSSLCYRCLVWTQFALRCTQIITCSFISRPSLIFLAPLLFETSIEIIFAYYTGDIVFLAIQFLAKYGGLDTR